MSIIRPNQSTAPPIKPSGRAGKWGFATLLVLAVGGLVAEVFYVRYHRPFVAAELAEAERRGPDLLNQISAPAGSILHGPLEKSVSTPNFKSKWHGIDNTLELTATWENVPGTPAQVREWYRERLSAQGWQPHPHREPSDSGSEWVREKWLLGVQHNEWWGGRDAHVRVRLRLNWYYGR